MMTITDGTGRQLPCRLGLGQAFSDSPAPGAFVAHLPSGPVRFGDAESALAALSEALDVEAGARAREAGAGEVELLRAREVRKAEVEGSPMFVEARLRVTAQGRARLATG